MQSYCFLLSLTTEDEVFYLKLWCRFRLDPGHFVKWETEPKMLTDLPKSMQITLESRVNSMDVSELKIINLSTPVDFSSLEGNPYLELPYWCPVLGETVLDKGPYIVPGLSCLLATTLISLPSHHLWATMTLNWGFSLQKWKAEFSGISHHQTAKIF